MSNVREPSCIPHYYNILTWICSQKPQNVRITKISIFIYCCEIQIMILLFVEFNFEYNIYYG